MILGASTLTVSSVAAGSYSLTTGAWTDGATTTFTVSGSWQPLTGREVQALPEAYRTRQTARLFTAPASAELFPSDPATGRRADVVTRAGRQYLVISASDWTDHTGGVPHRAYTLAEVGADQEVRP